MLQPALKQAQKCLFKYVIILEAMKLGDQYED